jgi:hypothetical protein
VYEHALTFFEPAGGFEHMVGGEALKGDGGRLVKVHPIRNGDQVPLRRYSVLGVAACPKERDYPIPDVYVLHALAYLSYGTRYLRARREGQLLLLDVLVPAAHGVRVVHPDRFDLNENLSFTRGGSLSVHVFQNVRLPELDYPDRLHLRHVSLLSLTEPAFVAGNYTLALY